MRIESPVKRFPGYVVLPEYLNLEQVQAITTALGDPNDTEGASKKKVWVTVNDAARLPALIACVSEWSIKGVPEKPTVPTFPMSPMKSVNALITWLFGEIVKLWTEETDIPNG